MAGQFASGMVLDFSVMNSFEKKGIVIEKNNKYNKAKECFSLLSKEEQDKLERDTDKVISALEELGLKEVEKIRMNSEKDGEIGISNDLTCIHKDKSITGISDKVNNTSIKNSRLSPTIDFGKKWLNKKCSETYSSEIKSFFKKLISIEVENFDEIEDKNSLYKEVLEIFKKEFLNLTKNDKIAIKNFLYYVMGYTNHFKVEYFGKNNYFNIQYITEESLKYNDLEISNLSFKENSMNTLILTLNNGFVFSFRIHNAEKKITASLKFDIKCLNFPENSVKEKRFII
jgi:hypothetical protein